MVTPVQNTLYCEIGLQCQMCKKALMLGLGSKLKKTFPSRTNMLTNIVL
jgi:hypothetical protein